MEHGFVRSVRSPFRFVFRHPNAVPLLHVKYRWTKTKKNFKKNPLPTHTVCTRTFIEGGETALEKGKAFVCPSPPVAARVVYRTHLSNNVGSRHEAQHVVVAQTFRTDGQCRICRHRQSGCAIVVPCFNFSNFYFVFLLAMITS